MGCPALEELILCRCLRPVLYCQTNETADCKKDSFAINHAVALWCGQRTRILPLLNPSQKLITLGVRAAVRSAAVSQLLTLLAPWAALAEFSRVNFSTLLCLSWNMREPRLEGRLSSSIITSLGTLIFFPRFRPSTQHDRQMGLVL